MSTNGNGGNRILSLTQALSTPKGARKHDYVPAKVFNAFVASVIEYTDGLAKASDDKQAKIDALTARLDAAGIYAPPADLAVPG